ncbi:MAG: hypothetical protein ACRCYO_05960 [Bacteroidia bacterium]
MKNIIREDLENLEEWYRFFTTQNNTEARGKLQAALDRLRYEIRMGSNIHLEYTTGMPEPMLMRVIQTEKDLERWIDSRFIRLGESLN